MVKGTENENKTCVLTICFDTRGYFEISERDIKI